MDKFRTKIYVKLNPDKNEIVYSGIKFAEFVRYLPQPIENLMIITGGNSVIFPETKIEKGFELFEGYEQVESLAKTDIHALGEFCFIDYCSTGEVSSLSDNQIAELLYIGHMFKPLHSPFFGQLNNRYVYLSHDDGWYCKLYCRNTNAFMSVLSTKIADYTGISMPALVQYHLLQLAEKGIFFDLDEIHGPKEGVTLNILIVGDYPNIDYLLSDLKQIKANSGFLTRLFCTNGEWRIQ